MKKIFSSSSTSNSSVDFDAEGRNLWARLNLDKSSVGGRQWNPIDPIWRNPNTNGTIYVGNQSAAENLRLLQSLGITHVVNCTAGQGSSQIPNYHEGKLKYYRFPISYWSSYVRPNDDESVSAFLSPVFAFIDEALVSGENILASSSSTLVSTVFLNGLYVELRFIVLQALIGQALLEFSVL